MSNTVVAFFVRAYHANQHRWANVRWANVRWANVRWAIVRWAIVRWANVQWANVRAQGNSYSLQYYHTDNLSSIVIVHCTKINLSAMHQL